MSTRMARMININNNKDMVLILFITSLFKYMIIIATLFVMFFFYISYRRLTKTPLRKGGFINELFPQPPCLTAVFSVVSRCFVKETKRIDFFLS